MAPERHGGPSPRGSACFCADDLQLALDVLQAVKERHADEGEDVLRRFGFDPDVLLSGVGNLISDVEAVAGLSGVPLDEAVQTLFIDGVLLGAVLTAIAPINHAAEAVGGRG